ncbi:hypothetical protein PHMEG_000395 [Phytophthora megakarya]|uniref:Uncharacterized protein n=1 Tax=Phytophthora megakarya TaxID=4795 RepID=A0A225X3U1_9STRA|nr:hypothetical protein PHMEG_000395 [Phytophthora megakarya]
MGKSVMTDLHNLHCTVNETEFLQKLADIQERWAKVHELKQFTSYFSSVWLNQRVWRWQCFHTSRGFATTNNPREFYNAAIKRDVTLRRKLKIGILLD